MKKDKRERYCANCFHFVQHADHDFDGFCAFAWPPYMERKRQSVSAYDSCSLYDELEESDIDIEFVEE
jgi:hypothetical protein